MAPRLELHEILKAITPNVYFQPKENVALEYPCIIYNRDFRDTKFADNVPYDSVIRYAVTVIDRDPDSEIPDKVAALPTSSFNRFFTADGLNHDVYQLYF
jgi:hypothetical protein